MLTVHLFSRLFVLVGDAPCHDYHHRRPGSRKWPSYIHERQADLLRGCPAYPVTYIETWGLFRAIDENLASLRATKKLHLLRTPQKPSTAPEQARPQWTPGSPSSGHRPSTRV